MKCCALSMVDGRCNFSRLAKEKQEVEKGGKRETYDLRVLTVAVS